MGNVYESHKRVMCEPMDRLAYNIYRGWDLPDDENGEDEGYLVEYLDGGKPNDTRHAGYISWSPKEQFDNGYTEVKETTFNDRLELELKDLIEKQEKLIKFFGSDASKHVLPAARVLLNIQLEVMQKYIDILIVRVEYCE